VLISSGCSRCDRSAVSIGELVTYWTDKANEICGASGVNLQVNARDGLPPVAGDGGKLTDIFTQLIKNAAEGAAEVGGGTVAIDIFPPGEASPGTNVDLFIRNSSHAMDAAALEKAFEPFHTTKGAEYFGIGLTTAAVLAGQMGMRLGLRHADSTTTAWLAMPPA
jgi:C4-dicarboxylate-specific signal transduction histidine kinase